MSHANAPLTPAGGLLMVRRVEAGMPQAHVARQMALSRGTVAKRWNRYVAEGEAGLVDRSSRPHRCPGRAPASVEERICRLRRSTRRAPVYLAARTGAGVRGVADPPAQRPEPAVLHRRANNLTRTDISSHALSRSADQVADKMAAMRYVENERKFLVFDYRSIWPSDYELTAESGAQIAQGYLVVNPNRSLRIRVTPEQATLTLKGPRIDVTRIEYETDIPIEMGLEMLDLCGDCVVTKIRYPMYYMDRIWAIDVFQDKNEGLVIAEVEFDRPNEEVKIPSWCGLEVTRDARYYNQNLAQNPFSRWGQRP